MKTAKRHFSIQAKCLGNRLQVTTQQIDELRQESQTESVQSIEITGEFDRRLILKNISFQKKGSVISPTDRIIAESLNELIGLKAGLEMTKCVQQIPTLRTGLSFSAMLHQMSSVALRCKKSPWFPRINRGNVERITESLIDKTVLRQQVVSDTTECRQSQSR